MTPLLFVHGWGMDASMWEPVRSRLPHRGLAVDLGYGGVPMMPALPARVIGVGHSFGGLWLLRELRDRLAGLVLVNGFARFTAAPDWRAGVPMRLAGRMLAAFGDRPGETLNAFRQRCGVPPWPGAIDAARLGDDLGMLAEFDARQAWAALGVARWCLAAADDPIVSLDANRATASLAGVTCDVSPTGGHMLPLTCPDWCAARIAAVA